MRHFSSIFPWVVIASAFIWASATIGLRRGTELNAEVKVIRIGHWQLEAGVREGFNQLADDFAALPEIKAKYGTVRIVQNAVPEGTYSQWVSTQMIGGTAPDLMEVGYGLTLPIWIAYQNRYFEPLTSLASAPNPFNKGTTLENTPLKDTILDGMRSGYQEELQAYMRIPLARFTTRIFYNRTLLKTLTGLEKPPRDFRAFIALCRSIATHRDASGKPYTPIASSKYHVGMWQMGLFDAITYATLFMADLNRDGYVGNDELFATIQSGAMSFHSPPIKAKFEITRDLVEQFQHGFTGLTRDEAVFLFAQQKAVFISTGTWDAGSLLLQAKGKFDVGVMTYPQPSKDDAEFGALIFGPNYDPAGPGFAFGVTRFSKHPELAREFLLYLASRAGNEKLNRIIGWIPSVQGTALPEMLQGFEPVNQGQFGCFIPELGGMTAVKYQQVYSRFQTDPKYSVDELASDFESFYKQKGRDDWEEQQRDWRRGIINNERFIGALRGEAMLNSPENQLNPLWIRYRVYTASRQVFPEITHARQQQLISNPPTSPTPPYTYTPEAMRRIELERKSINVNGSKGENP